VKPFALTELLARVRARLRAWDRERGGGSGRVLRFGGVTVDFDARSAVKDGKDLPLTPKEFELLAFFAGREGKALSRAQLLAGVWAQEEVVSRVVDTAILGLRKKIESDPASPRHVVSVRGLGYRFERRP
jgi:two-component system alkaline phosphatase synthesis response regulator PhoP